MPDPEVKPHARVFRRPESTCWQFYVTVPAHLSHHFPGKQFAFRGSLRTRDLSEANRRAKLKDAEWEAHFAELERQDNPRRVPCSPTLAEAIGREVRRWVLEADDNFRAFPEGPRALLEREERRQALERARQLLASPEGQALAGVLPGPDLRALTIGAAALPTTRAPAGAPEAAPDPLAGLTDEQAGALARWNAAMASDAALSMAGNRLRGVLPLAEAVARSMGLTVEWTTPEGLAGLREVLKAYRRATEDATRRDAGEVIDTPPPVPRPAQPQEGGQEAPGAPRPAGQGHTAMDAFDAWEKGKPGRPRKSVESYRAAAIKLGEVLQGKPLEAMTREDGRRAVAALLQEVQARGGGTAQNTAVKLLSRFKTLINVAEDLEWVQKNPLAGRTIERVKTGRKPWTPKDLSKLFDDPLFNAYALPTASMAGKDAAYWLPLLGLYTGARVSELAQLGVDDLQYTEDAGWVLRIHEEGEDKRVKNQHSVRTVPVHPELVRLGLTEYREAIKRAGAARLWPAVVFTELNGAGGKVGQWFGKFKTAKGFGPELVFHSFRHTLETELRALSVPKYHIAALAGHAGEDVSDDYAHPSPAVLRPHLERLSFPGLVLPRVFNAPAWKP